MELHKLDSQLKDIRSFLYNKYEIYFDKTDGYHKSSELYSDLIIKYTNGFSFSLFYKNYFDLDSISDIKKEIPIIDIDTINPILSKILLEHSKLSITKNNANKILNILGFSKDKINDLILQHSQNEHFVESAFQNKDPKDNIIDFEKHKETFYSSEIFTIIYHFLFTLKLNSVEELNMLNIINIIKEKENKYNEINELLFGKDIPNNLAIFSIYQFNNLVIQDISSSIYSYVFGDGRLHSYKNTNEAKLFEEINNDIKNNWYYDY